MKTLLNFVFGIFGYEVGFTTEDEPVAPDGKTPSEIVDLVLGPVVVPRSEKLFSFFLWFNFFYYMLAAIYSVTYWVQNGEYGTGYFGNPAPWFLCTIWVGVMIFMNSVVMETMFRVSRQERTMLILKARTLETAEMILQPLEDGLRDIYKLLKDDAEQARSRPEGLVTYTREELEARANRVNECIKKALNAKFSKDGGGERATDEMVQNFINIDFCSDPKPETRDEE